MVTKLDIAKLYIALFNRAPEKSGLDYWYNEAENGKSLEEIANAMISAAKQYPSVYPQYANYDPTNYNSVKEVINTIYQTLFNKDYTVDPEGIDYWTNEIVNNGKDLGTVVLTLEKAAEEYLYSDDINARNAAQTFINRSNVAVISAEKIDDADINHDGTVDENEFLKFQDIIKSVDYTQESIENANKLIFNTAVEELNSLPTSKEITNEIENYVGTNDNDKFVAVLNGITDNTKLLDPNNEDVDMLKVDYSLKGITPVISNIEYINVNGEYLNTGLDFKNISGTDVAEFNTGLYNGTVSIDNVNQTAVKTINIDDNIKNTNITTNADKGTGGTVEINLGNSDMSLTGSSETDQLKINATGENNSIVLSNLDTLSDKVEFNIENNLSIINNNATADNLELDINSNSQDNTVYINGTNKIANLLKLQGNNFTLSVENASAINGSSIKTDNVLSNTDVVLNGVPGTALDLTKAEVSNIISNSDLSSSGTIDINNNSELTLNSDNTGTVTINVDDALGTFSANDLTTNLKLNVLKDQTGTIETGTNVDTLVLNEEGDIENGKVNLNELSLNANTISVILEGTNSIVVNYLNNNSETDVVGYNFSGSFELDDFLNNVNLSLQNGNNIIKIGTNGNGNAALNANLGSGNDIVELKVVDGTNVYQAKSSIVNTGDGNDTVVTSGNGDTVNLGSGNDEITLSGGQDNVTTGIGDDQITSDLTNSSIINDFSLNSDKVTLTGTLNNNLDLTNLSYDADTEQYDLDGDGNTDDLTLKGINESNLSNNIALDIITGTQVSIVAGNLDDTIVDNNASTIETGAGNDEIDTVINGGTTVKDFTTGNDKIVITGTVNGNIDLTNVSTSSGAYDLDGDGTTDITLDNHTETDLTGIVQLGTKDSAIDVSGDTNGDGTGTPFEVTGGKFDDYIDVGSTAGNANKVHFIDNGGMDTIVNFESGTDILDLSNLTGIDVSVNGAGATDLTTATSKLNDALDGEAYLVDGTNNIDNDVIDFNLIGTTVGDEVVTFQTDIFTSEVAKYINSIMTTATDENYIVVVEGGDVNNDGTNDSLIYYVNGNNNGVTTTDLHLIGFVEDTNVAAGDIV